MARLSSSLSGSARSGSGRHDGPARRQAGGGGGRASALGARPHLLLANRLAACWWPLWPAAALLRRLPRCPFILLYSTLLHWFTHVVRTITRTVASRKAAISLHLHVFKTRWTPKSHKWGFRNHCRSTRMTRWNTHKLEKHFKISLMGEKGVNLAASSGGEWFYTLLGYTASPLFSTLPLDFNYVTFLAAVLFIASWRLRSRFARWGGKGEFRKKSTIIFLVVNKSPFFNK